MKDTTIAVDLAKNVFEIAISGEAGKVSKQLRVSRPKLVVVFCQTERCHRASRSLRLCSLLGKDVPKVGTRRRPAPTSPREALSTREQERPRRRQSVARGLQERGDSSRAHQVRAPAQPSPRSIACAQDGSPVVSKNTNELKTRLGCNKQVQMAKQPGGNKWPVRWPPHGRCPQRPRAGRWRACVPCGRPLRRRAGLPGLPPASSS